MDTVSSSRTDRAGIVTLAALAAIVLVVVGAVTVSEATKKVAAAEAELRVYQTWYGSPEGIEHRKVTRELERAQRLDTLECYAKHGGLDYDADLDCPRAKAPSIYYRLPPHVPSLWEAVWM